MKKIKNVISVLSLAFMMLVSLSVNSQSIFTEYENLGNIHNDFLDNVENNFIPTDEEDYDKKINLITEFNLNFINKTNLKSDEKENLAEAVRDFRYNTNSVEFYNNSFDSKNGVYKQLDELKSKKIIDDFSYNELLSLYKASERRESVSELISLVDAIKNRANLHYNGKNTSESRLLAIIIQISSSSFDWWNKNQIRYNKNSGGQQAVNEELALLAPWVAADAIGAAISAGVAATAQYATTGEVGNWGAVGISALGGAVTASTGVVGKLVKWFGW
ncbi:MAG: hypothetical protein GY739_04485 [Mesoflavibacter sp.]|nr:hypothetical protein [Mesoflavibacter sp.]